jgi:hypothetical protein
MSRWGDFRNERRAVTLPSMKCASPWKKLHFKWPTEYFPLQKPLEKAKTGEPDFIRKNFQYIDSRETAARVIGSVFVFWEENSVSHICIHLEKLHFFSGPATSFSISLHHCMVLYGTSSSGKARNVMFKTNKNFKMFFFEIVQNNTFE